MLNPFTGTGYDLAAMTTAINKLPNKFNRTESIFTPEPITTTVVQVEELAGTLNIVKSRQRGAPADKVKQDKRVLRYLGVPHFPIEDVLHPADYQNVRQFGSENLEETYAGMMVAKQEKMKKVLDQTREYLRMGALKGIILDADGTTLYSLYTEFGITQKTIDFVLDSATTEVMDKVLEAKDHIEMNLKGETTTGIRCLCSTTFFNAFTRHALVAKAFAAYQALGQNLAGDYRKGFAFGGVVFESYNASWTDASGNVRAAIAANNAIMFPEGTTDTFAEIIAPGDFIETANTPGLPFYSRQTELPYGKGVGVWAEMNVLPLCKRPEVLVTCTI